MNNSLILGQNKANELENFLEEVLTHAQQKFDPLYTNCISLAKIQPGTEIVSLNDYLQPDRILAEIKASSEYQKSQDLRIAASVWNTIYSWATLPGILTLMTWAGIGLDASLENVSFVLEEGRPKAIAFHDLSGMVIDPKRSQIPIPSHHPGKIVNRIEDLYQVVFTGLFQRNLAPMIDRVHQLTKLSKKTMWGNAVNASERLFFILSQWTDQNTINMDYSVLYEQPHSLVMPGKNPLYNLIDIEPNSPQNSKIRRTCCLYTFISPEHESCGNCPLNKSRQEKTKV